MRLVLCSVLIGLFFMDTATVNAQVIATTKPGAVPDALRERLKLNTFYQKHASVGGFPVVSSSKVSDNALSEAAWIVGKMLNGRKDILDAMTDGKVRLVVMAANEFTTDVPEHSNLKPKLYWDRRARGLGATPSNPVVSCAEENLLGYDRDPYPSENIMVHEFAHAIHGTGLNRVDPTFDKRLRASYEAAKERGLWKNTYAETNRAEYWAEGVQCWFDDNAPPDSLHNDIRTRAALKKYDTNLAKLCEEVFGDREWRYERPSKRKPADLTHLTDYDPKKLPKFRWREAPITDRPKVTIQTSSGDFDVELDAKAAPAATAQFLKVALDGGYHSSHFERTVHDKLHEKDPATGRLVAAINPVWAKKWADDLKLNDLSKSTIAPTDGTLAMMRGGANRGSFILFVGTANADPLDMVPFGRVTKGMDIIRKMLTGSVDIRRIIRSE